MGTHRAPRHSASRPPAPPILPHHTPAGGRRRTTKTDRVAGALHGLRLAPLPARPTLSLGRRGVAGLAFMAVAATAAVSLGPGTHSNDLRFASSTGEFGTDAIGYVPDRDRANAISRDSERQAIQAAQEQNLKDQAEAASAVRSAAITSQTQNAAQTAQAVVANTWHLPTENYNLTARFGMTSGLWASFHTGLDFAAPTGTPIFAVANGTITDVGVAGAYGNRTIETLDDGTEIWYAHQSSIGVKVGQKVIGGQQIGRVGSTGNTTGPHVHIEVRPHAGDPVDPLKQFLLHGVTP